MGDTVHFNPKNKCAADSPLEQETGIAANGLSDLSEYLIPFDYRLGHSRIPPADRKWRCDHCGGLDASNLFFWQQKIWKNEYDPGLFIKEYREIVPPIKVRCCSGKKCVREAKRLARNLLRERLRNISLPVPIMAGRKFWFPPSP